MLRLRRHLIRTADIPSLLSCDDGIRHAGGQIGILSEGFFHPSPTGLSCEIQVGGKDFMNPQASCFRSNSRAHLLCQSGVKSCAQVNGHREYRGARIRKPMKGLSGKNTGNSQTGFLYHIFLQPVQHSGNGINVMYEAHPSFSAALPHFIPLKSGVFIHCTEMGLMHLLRQLHSPYHIHLGGLLFQRHAGQQILYPFFHRKRGVLIIIHNYSFIPIVMIS